MEVKLGQQLFLDRHFGIIRTKQETVRQNDSTATVLLQPIHDDRHKEVSGFAAAKVSREILLHALFFIAAVRRIHQNDIEAVTLLVFPNILFQAVAMDDARVVDVVEQHIRGTQKERQRLLFDAVDGVAVNRSVLDALHLGIQHLQRRGKEAAGAAGKVRNRLTELGLDHLYHEVRDSTGRVEFAGVTGALQAAEDRFVNLTEGVAVLVLLKIDLINDIDNLAKQDAVLHVVIVVLEGCADNDLTHGGILIDFDGFEGREQFSVHEVQKGIAGERLAVLVVNGPIAPAQILRDDGGVILIVKLPDLLLGIIHLQKENPDHLLDTLGIAVDARIVTHDVLQSFYQVI